MVENKKKSRWKYVILGIIIMMFLGTVYSYSVFRISLEQAFDIGSAQSGLPYMTALAFYAIFMFITGRYIERFNPRTIILVGGFLVSAGWILSSFATGIVTLTIAYGCIGGAGVGIAYGVPMAVVAKWFPEKKGLAVGMVLIGFGLSPLVTAPLARQLVEYFGVLKAFLVLGTGFAVLLPFLSYPFKYPAESELMGLSRVKGVIEDVRELTMAEMVRTRSFKGLYLNFVTGTMVGLTIIGMTTSTGVEFAGMETGEVIGYMAVFAVFNGLGRPSFGWITDRMDSRKAMLLSYALIIAASLLLIVAGKDNKPVYIISFSILWFNLGGWLAIAPASTMKLYGAKNYARNYGLVFTAYGIGAIAGVSTSGLLLDIHKSYYFVFSYIIALCMAGVLVVLIMFKNDH